MEEALDIYRELGNLFSTAESLAGLGSFYLTFGDRGAAAAAQREALSIFVEVGNPTGIATALEEMAMVETMEGRHERALRLAGAASALKNDVGGGPPAELMRSDEVLDESRRSLDPQARTRRGTKEQRWVSTRRSRSPSRARTGQGTPVSTTTSRSPCGEARPACTAGGTEMTDDLGTVQSIAISAPITRVWEALTTPALIKRWFFGVETETDWKEGSPIIHRGEYQGRPYEDRGEILQIDPPRLLVHSHWSPVSGLPDAPENYERVAWELRESGGRTELTISESNLSSEEAKATSEQNWRLVLRNLKTLLER